jgi:small-conductance mechanosensitive channel
VNDIVNSAQQSLGSFLPRIVGALFVVLVGLLAARILGRITIRLLAAIGLDRIAERLDIAPLLRQVGIERRLSELAGAAVRLAVIAITVVAAISLIGFAALEQSLNRMILYLPSVFAALVLLLAGAVAARLVRGWAESVSDRLDLGAPIGQMAQVAVFAVFAVTALAQLAVPTATVRLVIELVLGAVALALALAFGLGSRDVARQIAAGRSVAGDFRVGQSIEVAGVRGRLAALGPSAVTIESEDGETVRVPNHLLVDTVVRVGAAPPPGAE